MIDSTEATERVDGKRAMFHSMPHRSPFLAAEDDQIREKLLWAVKREVSADGERSLLSLNHCLGQTNDGGGGDEKVRTRR